MPARKSVGRKAAPGRPIRPARPAPLPATRNANSAMPNRFTPDPALIRKLAEVINETGLTEIEYAEGDRRIRVARALAPTTTFAAMPAGMAAAPVASSTAAATPAPAADDAALRNAVTAPMVGTAYLAPEPNAAHFVKAGDRVNEGQTLLIIEAMKVMNPIKSPRTGIVKAVLIENAAPVEYGQPLVVIE